MIKPNKLAMAIRGAGGGAQEEPREPVEAPDSLRSIAYAQIVDLLSEGECYGWADPDHPMRCYYLNETVVENPDGTRNFKNITVNWRFGTQTQDYLRGMDTVENEIGAGVVLTYDTPWTHAFSNLELSAVRVRLSVQALTQTDTKTGDIDGYKVDYKIELATDGGSFVTVHTNSFNGKCSTKYERSHRIELPAAVDTGWIIRVSRTTPNSTTATIQDVTVVESYAELVDAKLRMPMSALCQLTVDASQFNAIPSRAHRWKGRIIRVPSNYDPVTREYDGIWDGTFQTRYSNNPAWCFYDMVLNDRYGLGHRIPAALVDKWALYVIGQRCDELVDDGRGGEEPRFVCNLYLQTRKQALQVLQDMATIFQGILYASQGAVTAVADMPSDPIYTYNTANVIDGKFTYTGSGRRVRHTVALVSWIDLNDFGRPKVEYIEDEEGVARYGVQPTEVIALGCTSQGQARRMGKYILTTERVETDAVAFGVGLDGTFVPPGSIIRVADPARAGRRIGGRIRSYTVVGLGAEIEVDHADMIAVGNDIVCILPTGLPQLREVSAVAGNVVSIDTAFDSNPIPQSVWAVEADELATQRYRVLGVSENTDRKGFTITALQHVEGKFAFIEDGIMISEPPTTVRTVIAAPEEVVVFDFERVHSNLPVLVMGAEWEPVENAEKYEVRWQRNSGNWSPPTLVQESRFELEPALPGLYRVKVASLDSNGFQSGPRISDETAVETPNFTIVTPIASDGGVLILDGAVGEQFLLILTEDIDTVLFYNISVETTFIIEVRNTADFDITFDASVVSASGVAYHPTTGGTVDQPKIDTIGLHTDNAGVTWTLRADLDDNPSQGGPSGPLAVNVTPNPAYEYAAANPSVDLVATVTGGTAPVTVLWTKRPGGVGDWDGSTGNTGGAAFTCSDDTSLTPTFSRTGTVDGYVAQNWQITATDATGLTAQKVVEITLEDDGVVPGTGGGQQCVWANAWMPDGRQAKDVTVGTRLMGVDPETMERLSLLVSYSKRAMAECYLLRCANGVELTCSDSAPIPTPDGLVLAPDMLGKKTITQTVVREWSEVVAVIFVGRMPVQHITAENGNFFAGNVRGKYMAHHNIKWPPEDLY
jgi:hypothetical protein